jgi:predicted Zn-dependent protease
MEVTSEDFIREISSVISKLNCDYAESRVSRSKTTLIVLSGESVDTISSGESISGSVRILNKGSWGFVSFNDLRDIERFARRCLEITTKIAGEEHSGIISSQPVRLRYTTPVVKDFTNRSLDEKLELSRHYNDILRDS